MVDGTTPWSSVYGKRKDRFYVFANKDGTHSVEFYQFLGYIVERVTLHEDGTPAGVHLAGRTGRNGEPIEMFGQVLMSIELERWKALEQHGIDGQSGQESEDAREKSILRDISKDDPMRGMGRRVHFRHVNETQAVERE